MALQVQSRLFTRRAMSEWNVVVRNLVEEMDLVLSQQQSCGDGMHRCVAPSLVEEATFMVQGVKIIEVGVGSQPVQTSNLKIRPLHL